MRLSSSMLPSRSLIVLLTVAPLTPNLSAFCCFNTTASLSRYLNARNNLLSGPLPEFLTSRLPLQYLDLSTNLLFSTLPSGLATLAGLSYVVAKDVRAWPTGLHIVLNGGVVLYLALCRTLLLNSNTLSGTVPSVYSALSALR